MVKKLYPDGKSKAFNITYDDGVLQDVRFVQLLNKYGIKGTFNLNSQLMADEFEWVHENGMTVKRLSVQAVMGLYDNHEIASHTLTHPYMFNMGREEIMYQLDKDKENLQKLFDREICGFAVPFDFYSELIAECAKNCGFEYARMSEFSLSYTPSENYYWWQTGIFHLDENLEHFVETFFKTDIELALCQIAGHSYDLDVADMWDKIEDILKAVSTEKDIAFMTNIEIVRYLKAMKMAVINNDIIENCSETVLWFDIDGKTVTVYPKEKFYIA